MKKQVFSVLLGSFVGGVLIQLAMLACGKVTTTTADARNHDAPATTTGPAVTGGIVAFAGPATPPDGWALCDGSEVSRTTFASLFAVIGTSWGNGDGATTFNLPDLRGRFLRGVDAATGRDPDAATRVASNPGGNVGDTVGTLQPDQLASHSHTFQLYPMSYASGGNTNGLRADTGGALNFATAALGGAESRPRNAAVRFIIQL